MLMFRHAFFLLAALTFVSVQEAGALKAPSLVPVEVVSFAKRVFHDFGENDGNITATAAQYQAEFDAANDQTDNKFSDEMLELFQLRAIDLEISLQRTRDMQKLISQLVGTSLQTS